MTTTEIARSGEEFRVRSQRWLSPDELRRLTALSWPRAALSLARTSSVIALCVAVALAWPRPAVVAVAILGIAAGQHGLAVLAHEAAHYRLFGKRWLNDLVGRACATPLFVSMITYRLIHRIHHNHLYESNDPDLALIAGYPRGRGYLLRRLAKDLLGLTVAKNYLYFFGRPQNQDAAALGDTSPALRGAAARDRAFVLAFNLASIAVCVASGCGRVYLLIWVLPLATLLQGLLRFRAVCEHGAVKDQTTPFTAARTNFAPPWIRWILFPHHVHYHIEHHLYPAVPHYRLAECHRLLESKGALRDAEVVRELRGTIARIFADATATAG
jgi:fatty acid desaturase